MKTIWKYPLGVADNIEPRFAIEMPKDAEILCVQLQYGKPCLWAIVETTNENEMRYFVLHWTGHGWTANGIGQVAAKYIGTYQLAGGELVFHLFETNITNEKHP